jgi:ubiquinone/menaquinone biosynthesis C-methylase UbiE
MLGHMLDPKRLVRAGYDVAARRYDEWSPTIDDHARTALLDRFEAVVSSGARVLELGCGTGLATARLAQRYFVVGVDFSRGALNIARERASGPAAALVQADMTRMGVRVSSFDAAVAFYSVIHVPREEQPEVLRSVQSLLRPGGVLLLNLGVNDEAASVDDDWLGVRMYWSSNTAEGNVAMVGEAGFEIEHAKQVRQTENGHDVTFQWIVARRGET